MTVTNTVLPSLRRGDCAEARPLIDSTADNVPLWCVRAPPRRGDRLPDPLACERKESPPGHRARLLGEQPVSPAVAPEQRLLRAAPSSWWWRRAGGAFDDLDRGTCGGAPRPARSPIISVASG